MAVLTLINFLLAFTMSSFYVDGLADPTTRLGRFLRMGETEEQRRSGSLAWNWKVRILVHLAVSLFILGLLAARGETWF
jgi:uncharacterized membrane protein YwzB